MMPKNQYHALSAAQLKLQDDVEIGIENLRNKVNTGLTKIIIKQLEIWKKRYPRHSFSAGVYNGVLHLMVDPPVCGQIGLSSIPHRFMITKEVYNFVDFFNSFDSENIGAGYIEKITR
jgi:hypothetical protein